MQICSLKNSSSTWIIHQNLAVILRPMYFANLVYYNWAVAIGGPFFDKNLALVFTWLSRHSAEQVWLRWATPRAASSWRRCRPRGWSTRPPSGRRSRCPKAGTRGTRRSRSSSCKCFKWANTGLFLFIFDLINNNFNTAGFELRVEVKHADYLTTTRPYIFFVWAE